MITNGTDEVATFERAERRMGEMLKAQKESGGMSTGTKGQLSGTDSSGGPIVRPPETKSPKLADMGITKSMSSRAQALAKESLARGQHICSR